MSMNTSFITLPRNSHLLYAPSITSGFLPLTHTHGGSCRQRSAISGQDGVVTLYMIPYNLLFFLPLEEIVVKLYSVFCKRVIWPICLILRVSTSMTAINCDQFAKILNDKLSPLNSRIAELKKSVDEAMNHVEFVNAKYDELLQMVKTSNDERKALQDEIKILQD